MLAITFKNLRARKLRLLTTGLAVLIGVAFMAGTFVLTDTIQRTFDDLFAGVNAGVDVQVRQASNVEVDGFEARGRLDESVVAQVAAVDGVATAVGLVQGYTQITGKDGEALGNPGRGAPTFGMTWVDDPDLNPFEVVEGRAPQRPGEVVVDRGSAKKGDLAVGDTIALDTAKPIPPMKLVGIVRFGAADSPGGASVVGYTHADAQAYIGEPGKVDAIVVQSDGVPTDDALRDRILDALPDGLEARTGAEITEEDQNAIGEGLGFFSTFMLSFALVALFVGSFIIYNTFSILVAQRARELALLRAVGASRRQVVGAMLVEALVVGLIASSIGIVVGIGVSGLLKALLAVTGFDIPAGGTVLTPRTVIVSLIVGVSVTMLAALLPARRAARIAPVAALHDVGAEIADHTGRRVVIGAVVAALGTALGSYGLFGSPDNPTAFVGIGGAIMFIGVAILGPAIARPVAGLIGLPLPTVRGVSGTLARENALRNPRRTSATAAALMIGVALISFIAVFASSVKAAIEDIVGEDFTADFVVQSGTFGFGGLEPGIATKISGLPEVGAATGIRFGPARIGGDGEFVAAVEPVAYAEIVELEVLSGSMADLGVDGIAMSKDAIGKRDWKVGDAVPATFPETGETQLVLRAVYEAQEIAPGHLITTAAHDANYPDSFDSEIYVITADGVSADRARSAIEATLTDQSNADLVDRAGYAEAQASSVNPLLALVYVLLLLAVVIAVLGIANTLALSIHERTRELGLLRAVGMTRPQLRSSVRWESMIIAVFGTTMGLAIGIAFAWAMVTSLADEGFEAFKVPGGLLVVVAVIATVCGVLASLLPAYRAARLDVLAAIATT
ncbi:MAG TPA: FtsX-like permease family protein [Acidimicrobiales bacterium]